MRANMLRSECKVVEAFSADWLTTFQEPFLDWVYLDASHKYDAVLSDLRNIAKCMKPEGVILGDDCWLSGSSNEQGVATALNDFLEESDYDIVYHDQFGQWALQKPESDA